MLHYVSTRGYGTRPGDTPKTFVDVTIEGLAPDGGLYMPEAFPKFSLSEFRDMRGKSPAEIAYRVMRKFAYGAIPDDALSKICAKAYSSKNFSNGMRSGDPLAIVPLIELYPGRYLGELSNGPTLAFKDFALLLLGYLLSYAYENGYTDGREIIILVATSGDTGPATLAALRDLPGIKVVCISGEGLPTPLQAAQMYSVIADNVSNIVIQGDFDDGQKISKALMNDPDFRSRFLVGSANSINWARIAAQTIYYVLLYLAATESEEQQVDFAVQTGNCGNFVSGYIAKKIGLPIRNFYVVSNENTVFPEFLNTGRYHPTGKSKKTSSSAMDVDDPSNFERYLYMITDGNAPEVARLMTHLKETGSFDISGQKYWSPDPEIIADSCYHAGRLEAARELYEDTKIILDPHTANTIRIAMPHFWGKDGVPMIFLETAQWIKFAEFVREALEIDPPIPETVRKLMELPKQFVTLPATVEAVKEYIIAVYG